MRKVLQNGMSFANERNFPAVSLRVRYYFLQKFCNNCIGLSKNVLGDFFMSNLFLAIQPFDVVAIFKSIVTRWYLYLLLVAVIVGVMVFAIVKKPKKTHGLTKTQQIAYISLLVALSVVTNIVQIPFPLVQLSFVAVVACVAGVLLGPVDGFTVAFLGDLIAGIIAPRGVYSPIIGIGTAMFGFVPGVVFGYLKKGLITKAIISFAITFVLTSVVLNTFGLCLIYPAYYVLTEKLLLLPLNLLFHIINCIISIFVIKLLGKTLPKYKFEIHKHI